MFPKSKRLRLIISWHIAFGLALLLALLPLAASRRSSAASREHSQTEVYATVSTDTSGFFVTFNQVADSATAIPEGTGTFTNFPYA
ncbi:MAG TPA: hypothetical protein VGQ39_02015 [Pyrinomonadaceae bacterium]|nr:hypothetical protein [Pyrinomonadaceae bacterium]